jgi:hypothetical protein
VSICPTDDRHDSSGRASDELGRDPHLRLRHRLTTTLSLALASIALLCIGATGPALADEVVYAYSINPAHAGEAVFDPNGEHYYIYDRQADGHSVVVVNYRSDLSPSGPYYGWNHTGAGTAKDYDLSMPEGTRVTYYVCLGEYGSRTVLWNTCGATHSATA